MTLKLNQTDHRSHAVLFVDDEPKSRKYFQRLYGGSFRIIEAADGVEALKVFRARHEEIGVVVTDQRMPNDTGTGFLAKISGSHPDVVKILSTAYSDLDAAIDAVNRGGIYRYITKPWDVGELELTLRRAMELFLMTRERERIVAAKVDELAERVRDSRLAAFALAPVAAGLPVRRAAEAVAALVRLGAVGALPASGIRSMREIHSSQLEQVARLEQELRKGFAGTTLGERVEGFLRSLPADELLESAADGGGFRVLVRDRLFPHLLAGLLGRGEPGGAEALAAVMGIYDAGGSMVRDGAMILIHAAEPREEAGPGMEAIRWIFDGDLIPASHLPL